jgi:hypothetical protein
MRKILLAFALVLAGSALHAQDENHRGPRQIENKFAFKFTPTQLIMGELNLSTEFRIARKLSLDIDFGPTLSQVGLGGRSFEDFDEGQEQLVREGSFGYFGALGLRFYPFEKTSALTRMYLHPQLKYRVYNTLISEETEAWDEINATNTQYKFLFNIGWQLWTTKNFGFDFYLGGGLGYRQLDICTPILTYADNTFTYSWEVEQKNSPQLLMNAGIKLAFGK